MHLHLPPRPLCSCHGSKHPHGSGTLQACVERAVALAQAVASQGPAAVRSILALLRRPEDDRLRAQLVREATVQAKSYAAGEVAEGVTAVRERRKAKF
jgi:hypothetical protein